MRKTLFSTPFSLLTIIFLIVAFCFFGITGIATAARDAPIILTNANPVQDLITACIGKIPAPNMPGQIIEMKKDQDNTYVANIRGSTIHAAIVDETDYTFADIIPYYAIIPTGYILRGLDAKDIVPSASIQEVYQGKTECAFTSTNLKFFHINRTDGQSLATMSRAISAVDSAHQASFIKTAMTVADTESGITHLRV